MSSGSVVHRSRSVVSRRSRRAPGWSGPAASRAGSHRPRSTARRRGASGCPRAERARGSWREHRRAPRDRCRRTCPRWSSAAGRGMTVRCTRRRASRRAGSRTERAEGSAHRRHVHHLDGEVLTGAVPAVDDERPPRRLHPVEGLHQVLATVLVAVVGLLDGVIGRGQRRCHEPTAEGLDEGVAATVPSEGWDVEAHGTTGGAAPRRDLGPRIVDLQTERPGDVVRGAQWQHGDGTLPRTVRREGREDLPYRPVTTRDDDQVRGRRSNVVGPALAGVDQHGVVVVASGEVFDLVAFGAVAGGRVVHDHQSHVRPSGRVRGGRRRLPDRTRRCARRAVRAR